MYLQHFGLAQYPFSLTPNTRFFLKLPSHQQAFSDLLASLNQDSQVNMIWGEVGTGKTMLCRKTLNALEAHPQHFTTAYIPHPILNEEALMHSIAEELALDHDDCDYRALLKMLSEEFVKLADSGRRVVLFIDEAQAMPEDSLQAVHLLTGVRNSAGRHLQVVLFGQPELVELLNTPPLKPLLNDLGQSYQLPTMDRTDTENYVQHRLSKAGHSGPHMFTRKALDLLYEGSSGVPRMINILCHKAMLSAFGTGERMITENHIKSAIADTELTTEKSSWTSRLLSR